MKVKAFQSWLKKPRLNKLSILFFTALLILKGIYYIQTNPQFYLYWDAPGHLQKALIADFPWNSGWDTTFWGGYPTSTYPNLSHLILNLFIRVTSSVSASFSFYYLLLLFFFVISLSRFIKHFIKPDTLRFFIFTLTLFLFIIPPPYLLGGFHGTFVAGSFTALLAIVFLLNYFSETQWWGRALWAGLIINTHTLTATVLFAYLSIRIISKLVHFILQKPTQIKKLIYEILLTTVLALPWLLVVIDPSISHSASNFSRPYSAFILALFIVLLLLIYEKRLFNKYSLFIVSLLTLSLIPTDLSFKLQQAGFRGFHFYRYLIYFALLAPTFISIGIQTELTKLIQNAKILTRLAIISILVLAISLTNHTEFALTIDYHFDNLNKLEGRYINAASAADTPIFIHALNNLLATNTNLNGGNGLFYESSELGVLYYSLIEALNPRAFKTGSINAHFDQFKRRWTDAEVLEVAKLLGVNYAIVSSLNQEIEKKDDTIWQIATITQSNNPQSGPTAYLYLDKLNDEPLITTLSYIPEQQPDLDLGEWWVKGDIFTPYIKNQPDLSVNQVDFTQPAVKLSQIEPTKITFVVDSPKPAPTLLKFSYSPHWQSRPANSQGHTTQPQWITPGFMLLFSSGEIILEWRPPIIYQLYSKLSAFTLIILIIFYLAKKLPAINKKPTT
jgi:hypothetical protein